MSGTDGLAWHYTNGPGLLSILAGHTLWATASPFLNDQQEVALGGRRIQERSRELAAERGDAFFADLGERVSESADTGRGPGPGHCYILSASRAWDSLAMWRLYGGAQESYAIGLDPAEPLAALASRELTLSGRADGVYLRHQAWRPVAYGEAEQRELVDRALSRLPALGRLQVERDDDGPPELTAEQEALVEGVLDDLQQALLLIKHEGFADEREIRYSVVFVAGPDSDRAREIEARLLSYRSTGYGIAPYLRLTGLPPERLLDDDPDNDAVPVTAVPSPLPVRAVAMSPSPNGEEATRSLRQVLLAHGYDVPVLRSAIPFRG